MPITAPTPIDAWPAVPDRSQPQEVFSPTMGAFLAAFPSRRTQMNNSATATYQNALSAQADATSSAASALAADSAKAAALTATDLVTTSATNVSLTAGAKDLALGATNLGFANGDRITGIRLGDPRARFRGAASLCNMAANPSTMRVTVDDVTGAGGPFNDWLICLSTFETLLAGTAADLNSATPSNIVAITPKAEADAAAYVALAYASTVAWDVSAGKRRTLNASASFTLGTPSNCKVGDVLEALITNTAGAIVLAVTGVWKRQNGLFVMDPANGHTNKLTGIIEAVDGSNNATSITYGGLRNPTT